MLVGKMFKTRDKNTEIYFDLAMSQMLAQCYADEVDVTIGLPTELMPVIVKISALPQARIERALMQLISFPTAQATPERLRLEIHPSHHLPGSSNREQ